MRLFLIVLLVCLAHSPILAQNNYEYDQNGRLTSDLSEGIQEIQWNNQGRITAIIRSSDSEDPDLEFYYDNDGNRSVKLVKYRDENGLLPENEWVYTHYVYGPSGDLIAKYVRTFESLGNNQYKEVIQGKEQTLYSSGALNQRLVQPAFFRESTFEAEIGPDMGFTNIRNRTLLTSAESAQNMYTLLGKKHFELGNHVRDVQVVHTDRRVHFDKGGELGFQVDLKTAQDFDPFGMVMNNRVDGDKYDYGFAGYESDHEIKDDYNSYTTHHRQYDPRLGRWLGIDPQANIYPHLSPYSGFGNNPLIYLDENGDVLRVWGSGQDQVKFLGILNKALGGIVELTIKDPNLPELTVTTKGNLDKLTDGQRALYNALNQIVTSKEYFEIGLNPENQRDDILIGQWQYNTRTIDKSKFNGIDMADIAMFEGKDFSPEAALIHEIYESYLGQSQGLSYEQAHQKATNLQTQVDGVVIQKVEMGILNQKARAANMYYLYYRVVNNKVIRKTVAISTVNGDVVKIETLDDWTSYKQYDIDEDKKRKPFVQPAPAPTSPAPSGSGSSSAPVPAPSTSSSSAPKAPAPEKKK